MNERLLIVDGSLLLFQMFYGMPNKIYSKQPNITFSVHGIIGFIGGLLKTIKMVKPTHMTVIFDGEIENERRELDDSYKSNRVDFSQVADDENPFVGLPYIYQCLTEMGIHHLEMTELEGDDYIAYLALKAPCDVIISSKDKDFFQLIDNKIKVLAYAGKNSVLYDEQVIIERFGIKPSQMSDFKALFGDSSDNIKKVPGCGLITTKNLINQFNDIDNLYEHIDLVKNDKLRNNLLMTKEMVYKNKQLVTFRKSSDWSFDLKDFLIKKPLENITTTMLLASLMIL